MGEPVAFGGQMAGATGPETPEWRPAELFRGINYARRAIFFLPGRTHSAQSSRRVGFRSAARDTSHLY
jgi:hypothetical protein